VNMGKMMKDLQRMQERMQQDVERIQVEGTSGGGVVRARMDGKKHLLALHLAAEAITPDDPELTADLVLAAVNEAARRVDEEVERITRGLAAGLGIPGLPGL